MVFIEVERQLTDWKPVFVNLTNYPRFWQDFAARGSAFDPSAMVTPEQFEHWVADWYGLDITVQPGDPLGHVHMSKETYVEFLLQWQ